MANIKKTKNTQNIQDVYVISVSRSAICKSNKGKFANTRPDDILAELLKKSYLKSDIQNKVSQEQINDVIIGCAMPEAQQGLNIARVSSLLAGFPVSVPAMTLNRFCASGLQSIAQAADKIASNNADLIIAGGIESMSCIPMMGNTPRPNIKLFSDDKLIGLSHSMGITAETLVDKYKISKLEQDKFAYNSHKKALKAQKSKLFDKQIIDILGVKKDEGPRLNTSIKKLSELNPVFKKNGSVTAGNSSQVSDGAAVCILASGTFVKKYKLKPLARFCGYSVSGVDPKIMGVGPVGAINKVLQKLNLKDKDLNWIEINEAFAAQVIAVCKDMGWRVNDKRINPHGGAIALGHPLGASGAILTSKLILGMKSKKQKGFGLVSLCVGGGMGIAGVFEVF